MSLALRGEDLVLELGGQRVLDGVSVALVRGEWLAIVGPNGAGKSSLLSVLAGLRAPLQGRVQLQGRDLREWPPRDRARQLAWLAQQGEAEGEIAVRDVVRLGRLPHHGLLGAPGPEDEAAVDQALDETECRAFEQRRLSALSGGERQRVLLARVLATRSPVLLLDEPTSHLDAPHQRALCRGLIARARAGAAVASVLHDLTLALMADRVVVMAQGRVHADGPPADAALRQALVRVFGGALSIEPLAGNGIVRWVAVPRV